MGNPNDVEYNDIEKTMTPPNEKEVTNVNVLPANSTESSVVTEGGDLGHVPERRKFNFGRFLKSLVSKDAWFGDYVSTSPSVQPRLGSLATTYTACALGTTDPSHHYHAY